MPWSTPFSVIAGRFGAKAGAAIGDAFADVFELSDQGRKNARRIFGVAAGAGTGAFVGYLLMDPVGAHGGGTAGAMSVDFDPSAGVDPSAAVAPSASTPLPDTSHGGSGEPQFGNFPDRVTKWDETVHVPTLGPEVISDGPNAGTEVSPNDTYPKPPDPPPPEPPKPPPSSSS